MKTNVSIKFNSIEEYREIEKKLIELGYLFIIDDKVSEGYVVLNTQLRTFGKFEYVLNINIKQYNSLQEFLNDKAWKG